MEVLSSMSSEPGDNVPRVLTDLRERERDLRESAERCRNTPVITKNYLFNSTQITEMLFNMYEIIHTICLKLYI